MGSKEGQSVYKDMYFCFLFDFMSFIEYILKKKLVMEDISRMVCVSHTQYLEVKSNEIFAGSPYFTLQFERDTDVILR